jgi:hypothetical protein
MVDVFMALLSFVDSTPRAYRLKASNAAPLISTSVGTFPIVLAAAPLALLTSFPAFPIFLS